MKKFSVGWGLTNKCNMACDFCYSKNARSETQERGFKDWVNFINRNHQHIEAINYGTGENVIIDEFFYFAEYVRKSYPEIKQALTTNGFVSERVHKNPRFMEIFKNAIDEVDVSVDFNDREKHNRFRGQPKAYDWAIKTLKLNKELEKPNTIVFVGFDETFNEENLDGLFNLTKEHDALLRMNIYRPVSQNNVINKKYMLSYGALINGLQYIHDKYEIVSLSDSLLGNVFADYEIVKDNTGQNSIRILADGTIYPSTYLIGAEHRSNVNIDNTDLCTLRFQQFENVEVPKECKDCKYEGTCQGGVYDRRILWYKTFAERDPYCPTRHDHVLPEKRFPLKKLSRISIHDGYLPTLFFKNRDENADEETIHTR